MANVPGFPNPMGFSTQPFPSALGASPFPQMANCRCGTGVRGMLGVGAYDSNPNNAVNNSKFSGVENQLRVGAKTFANLRKKGGASPQDPVDKQIAAVNSAGWATDKNWHKGVSSIYRQVSQVVK